MSKDFLERMRDGQLTQIEGCEPDLVGLVPVRWHAAEERSKAGEEPAQVQPGGPWDELELAPVWGAEPQLMMNGATLAVATAPLEKASVGLALEKIEQQKF